MASGGGSIGFNNAYHAMNNNDAQKCSNMSRSTFLLYVGAQPQRYQLQLLEINDNDIEEEILQAWGTEQSL